MSGRTIIQAEFATRLRAVMEEKRLTQHQLAQIMEVTQPTVSYWLNEGVPGSATRVLLSQRLDVSLNWLLYGDGLKEGMFTKHLQAIDRARIKYEPLLEHYESLIRENDERADQYRAKIREIRSEFDREVIESAERSQKKKS